MMCRSVTLLPVPLRPRMTNPAPARHLERHVVEHFTGAEGLRHVVEPHRRAVALRGIACARRLRSPPSARRLWKHEEDQPHEHHVDTMISIDERTTARVEARPTPSVPDSVLNPRYDEIGRDDEPEHHRLDRRRHVVGDVDQRERAVEVEAEATCRSRRVRR